MRHDEKYMIKNIKDVGIGRISMSIDENPDKDEFEVGAMMLLIPNIGEDAHSYISLDKDQAFILRNWLDDFLTTPDLEERLTDGKET